MAKKNKNQKMEWEFKKCINCGKDSETIWCCDKCMVEDYRNVVLPKYETLEVI